MTHVDHLFLLLLLVGQPIAGAWSHRRFMAAVEAGEPPARKQLYRNVHLLEWPALAVLLSTWFVLDRPLAALGFKPPGGTGFLVALAFVLAVCVYLLYALRKVRRMPGAERARQVDSLGSLRHFLPQTRDDFRRFLGVSVAAGIVEEIIYRGFLFWYLQLAMPWWAALLCSSVIFGLGHSYQGVAGMLRVTLVGMVAAGLYLVSGSIWIPIVAHMLFDMLQGAIILELQREPGD